MPLAVGICPAILVVGVPFTTGISPAILVVGMPLAILVVRVVGVPFTTGIGPAVLVVVVVIRPVTGADIAIIVPLAVSVGPAIVVLLTVLVGVPLAVLVVGVVGVPFATAISPAILILVVIWPVTRADSAIIVPLTVGVSPTALTILPVVIWVLSTRVPLTRQSIGVHGKREDRHRGDCQQKKAVDHRVAHLEGK